MGFERENKQSPDDVYYRAAAAKGAGDFPPERQCALPQRLKSRRQFLRVSAGNAKWASRGLILQIAAQPIGDKPTDGKFRYGLTVSKKVGNAVKRNRTRRRLRALAEEILPVYAKPAFDYVIIGRRYTDERDFESLKLDLKSALAALQQN